MWVNAFLIIPLVELLVRKQESWGREVITQLLAIGHKG